ncbi:hypothetical protein CISG_08457 [Coccidioides immitis RMSCC 3703]|uniref:Uncharacterized protein n=1 Tax=Coccidioides immitis RMSCC 3703 TaxID=454286 RepID=A0A0J8R6R5_COCIT|nr:hypothetical protein CISG_08457 [Coccidioides immitis RMSCC 3703]
MERHPRSDVNSIFAHPSICWIEMDVKLTLSKLSSMGPPFQVPVTHLIFNLFLRVLKPIIGAKPTYGLTSHEINSVAMGQVVALRQLQPKAELNFNHLSPLSIGMSDSESSKISIKRLLYILKMNGMLMTSSLTRGSIYFVRSGL